MDEITMFTELKPDAPGDAELESMQAGARERLTATATLPDARKRRRWRRPVLAATLTAAVSAATAIAVVAPGGQARHLGTVVTAAWTVRGNTDGTVTIQLHQLIDPAKLQRVLRADGVNAIVGPAWYKGVIDGRHTYVSCQYQNLPAEPPAVQRAVVTSRDGFTIRPSAMPPGSALFIGDSVKHEGNAGYGMVLRPVVLKNSELPPCTPVP
ncbi:MAG TPA: hypothetical protein VF070_11280 [Streptosporangiaceae bacterium]